MADPFLTDRGRSGFRARFAPDRDRERQHVTPKPDPRGEDRHDRSLPGGIQKLSRLGSRVRGQRRLQTQLQIPPADPAHLARIGADCGCGLARLPPPVQ